MEIKLVDTCCAINGVATTVVLFSTQIKIFGIFTINTLELQFVTAERNYTSSCTLSFSESTFESFVEASFVVTSFVDFLVFEVVEPDPVDFVICKILKNFGENKT